MVQNIRHGAVVAQRKLSNARVKASPRPRACSSTSRRSRSKGGEVSHYDAVKAQIQIEQRQRDVQEAQLAIDKVRFEACGFCSS